MDKEPKFWQNIPYGNFFQPQRERGDNGLNITLVHKVVVLIVGLTTLGTFTEFLLVGLLSWVFKRFNQ